MTDSKATERPEFDCFSTSLKIEDEITIPPDSNWFSGHFPGAPVLPGVAQLHMVQKIIEKRFSSPIRIIELKRVRFKLPVFPGDKILLTINPKDKKQSECSFTVRKNNDIVCTGLITVEKTAGHTINI